LDLVIIIIDGQA